MIPFEIGEDFSESVANMISVLYALREGSLRRSIDMNFRTVLIPPSSLLSYVVSADISAILTLISTETPMPRKDP